MSFFKYYVILIYNFSHLGGMLQSSNTLFQLMYKQKGYSMDKYKYSIHQSGYITVKNLLDETIAVIDYNERLSFTKDLSREIRDEVKDFLLKEDIPFFS